MTLVADNAFSLGIHADSASDTITVQVDRPVDSELLARIEQAVSPLIAVHPAKVQLMFVDQSVVLELGNDPES